MTGPYSSAAIANAVLERASAEKTLISPMKLQKLIYFTHGYYLAASKLEAVRATPLVDEFFEAWKYGPVLPSVYKDFKEFGSNGITRLALEYNPEARAMMLASTPNDDPVLDNVLNFVWQFNAKRTAAHLSNITHKVGGAWDKAYKEAEGLHGKDIPNDYILADFEPFVKKKVAA